MHDFTALHMETSLSSAHVHNRSNGMHVIPKRRGCSKRRVSGHLRRIHAYIRLVAACGKHTPEGDTSCRITVRRDEHTIILLLHPSEEQIKLEIEKGRKTSCQVLIWSKVSK
jgi:hypothetical protein